MLWYLLYALYQQTDCKGGHLVVIASSPQKSPTSAWSERSAEEYQCTPCVESLPGRMCIGEKRNCAKRCEAHGTCAKHDALTPFTMSSPLLAEERKESGSVGRILVRSEGEEM